MDGFADKLTLVIKTLGISRAELGAALAVDKSVVSRWFAGARAPTAHNLAAITALVAARAPGFTMLDWDRDLAGLEPRLRPGGAMAVGPDNTLSLALPPGAAAASAARGVAVTGVWRLNYSAGITEQPGQIGRAHV